MLAVSVQVRTRYKKKRQLEGIGRRSRRKVLRKEGGFEPADLQA
jgi:hypothetical protein